MTEKSSKGKKKNAAEFRASPQQLQIGNHLSYLFQVDRCSSKAKRHRDRSDRPDRSAHNGGSQSSSTSDQADSRSSAEETDSTVR